MNTKQWPDAGPPSKSGWKLLGYLTVAANAVGKWWESWG